MAPIFQSHRTAVLSWGCKERECRQGAQLSLPCHGSLISDAAPLEARGGAPTPLSVEPPLLRCLKMHRFPHQKRVRSGFRSYGNRDKTVDINNRGRELLPTVNKAHKTSSIDDVAHCACDPMVRSGSRPDQLPARRPVLGRYCLTPTTRPATQSRSHSNKVPLTEVILLFILPLLSRNAGY
jgi:hypothetical protein